MSFNIFNNNKYKIIDFDEIFENIIDFFSNKSLNEFCQLNRIAFLLKKSNSKKINIYYDKVHQKGMDLIKNNKLSTEEIVNFIFSQDIFYYDLDFKNNNNRDPLIFKYIPITDIDKNYLNNIKLLKDNSLYFLYFNSDFHLKKKFYKVIIAQIKKIKDFASIFSLFPLKYIDRDLTFELNSKLKDLIYTILDEKDNNLLFEIFDNIFICNDNNNFDLNYLVDIIKINYNFPLKYFCHLLTNKNMAEIEKKLRDHIINFFLIRIMKLIIKLNH